MGKMTRREALVRLSTAGAAFLPSALAFGSDKRPGLQGEPTPEQIQDLESGNPFLGKELFVNPNSRVAQAARDLESSNPEAAQALEVVAQQPIAEWFGNWNQDITAAVDGYVAQATEAGALPVLVAYNIPNRDNGGYSAGGAQSAEEYLAWIDNFAAGLQGRNSVVIFEPDATGFLDRFAGSDRTEREQLMSQAVQKLEEGGADVYIEASQWVPAADMVQRLEAVGIEHARGISLNTSGYLPNETVLSNLEQLNQASERPLPAVIDTSRNGGNVAAGEWANPAGAALGPNPTSNTGHELVDAFLWIKNPAESDGNVNGGPNAGELWPERVVELVRNREAGEKR